MIMEKIREARSSSTIVAANGSSRRRSRTTAFRDLPEEGQVELQETVRLRDRGGRRDRDREFASRSKRRRGGGSREEEVEEEEGGETSAEDMVADGDGDEVEDGGGVSRILSSTTASSTSNQNQRRNSIPPRVAKQQWKVVDDAMIGVPVPRKARSASVKRSHDCTVSGNSGVGAAGEDIADHSHRYPSDSPARSSAEVVSPSTSMFSSKKKMKQTGPKTRSMKMSKVSSPSAKEGDIEIEIAEVLFGLKKQPQCTKKQEVHVKQSSDQETENSSVLRVGTKSPVTSMTANSAQTAFQKSVSLQKNGAISDLLLNVAVEKKKVDSSSSLPQSDSLDCAAKGESEKPGAIEIYPSKCEGASDFSMNLGSHGSKPAKEFCIGGDDNKGSKKTELKQEDVPSCAKGDVDPEGSPPTKSIPEAKKQKEEKFKFDLMAPPTSPERDGLADMELDAKPLSLGREMGKETLNKVENEVDGFKEKEKVIGEDKMVTSGKNIDFFKLDLEKPHLESNNIIMQEQSQKQQQLKGAVGTVEKNEPSTSVRLPTILGGWPTTEIPSVGYMPPFRTVLPVDGVDKSSNKLQHPNFILSQPRPKRCLTHYDVARNIYLHQQFTKTNYFHPLGDASASLAEAKLKNRSSKEGMILSNPLGGNHLDVNHNSVQQRVKAEVDFPGNVISDKSPEASNFADMAKSKQLVFQQRQGGSSGNSVPGSGFIFPISQHQAPMATTANQSGSTKPSNQSAGTLVSFPALPTVSSNMSYSHPNVVSIEAPYLAKLQNNGYPFTFSTPAGTSATYRASNAQPMPLFNGSFYPSQMFHPAQIQQAQTQSHHQPSGSHKQQQTQQQQWNNLLPSNGMQVKSTEQHLPLSNQSRKHESETSGEDTTSLSDKRAAPVQKNAYGQNFILPVQALGFTLMPSATLNNGNGGNNGEKKQSHPQNLKNTVALVPSQGLTMSFASYNGNGTPSNLNFTPMARNPTVFQNLPDIQRAGFQVAPAPQPAKQKNPQNSEGRNGVILSSSNDRSNGNSSAKPSASSGQTLVFGNSARTLNFMTSSVPVNWPPPSTKPAPSATNRPAGSSSSNQQQQPLLQLPQQHILQQQQATMASRMAPRTKVPTNNSLPSSATTKFPCNPPPGFSQPLTQCDNSVQSSAQQKNSGRMVAPVAPMTSLHLASSTAVHKNSTQQKGSTPHGQTQISFGGDFKPAFTQMQHIPSSSNHSPSSSGKVRNTSSKTSPSVAHVQPKQDESSSSGPGQKSSPVCGRNVPSILNTCPSHISELKY